MTTLVRQFFFDGQSYPQGLIEDAEAYANRRACREFCSIYVYARGGVVFVRAAYEPKPEGSRMIYHTVREGLR